METYDIIMLVVLAAATLFGALKGLAWQVASLASIFASYFVSYQFRSKVAGLIQADPPWNIFLAMLLLYVGSSAAIWLTFKLIGDMIDRLRLREFDRQIGALFGFAKGALFCVLITLFSVTLLGESHRQAIVRSVSGRYIARVLHDADRIMPREVQTVLRPYVENLGRQVDGAGPEAPQFPGQSVSDSPFGSLDPRARDLAERLRNAAER